MCGYGNRKGATKANQPPIRYKSTLNPYTQLAALRVRMQASRKAGLVGQGAKRLRHCSVPLTSSITPAKANNSTLYSLNTTNCGTTEMSDDSAAPAPSATRSAGSAQHSKVLELANKLAMEDHKPERNCGVSFIILPLMGLFAL